MSMLHRVHRITAPMAVALAVVTGACSTSSPFSSSNSTELTFITAAQTWDLNKDNIVTCAEWKQYTTQLFQESDANRDGIVTPDEYAKIAAADRLFETIPLSYFDANGDGKLSLAEFADKPNPAFKRLDKNNDCQITSDEMVQFRGVDKEKAKGADDFDPRGKRPGG